ncbi:unnamed protein product [Prorocentrum cordatum]|uniref:Uncharacterized protein n=1 Tax=Prorocentrum cordatum TaxID=2364126 RepID=A0ABN9XRJ5_9DINO|nr:unnamed protein product [Polarella glacialis]
MARTSPPSRAPTSAPASAATAALTVAPAPERTMAPTSFPTPAPTAAPTSAPTVAPSAVPTIPFSSGVSGISGVMAPVVSSADGHPRLVNVQGQHLDLMRHCAHVLLAVVADAQQIGGTCAGAYFVCASVAGKSAEPDAHKFGHADGIGFFFAAG